MPTSNDIKNRLTFCEIDLAAVRHNVRALVKMAAGQGQALLAVIKADAYGHGAAAIAPLLDRAGVGFFGVSDIPEGAALRRGGIGKPILLFESTLASQAEDILHHRLTPTVCTYPLAAALNRAAEKRKRRIDVHVKVDTGMGRLGIRHEEAFDFIRRLSALPGLRITGIFTHFPAADTDRPFTRTQVRHVYDLVTRLDRRGLIIPYIHAANSMGLAGYRTRVLNVSRPGLMLYGLYPAPGLKQKIRLKSVMSVRSRVIFLKDVAKGHSISYGRTFWTKKDIRVATVPIGYNDGYFRALSNRAHVLIGGVRCPVIGRVTMDQIMVDASRVKSVRLGSPVTVLGRQRRAQISADELARRADTINYEIVCALGNRLPRVYKHV